MYKVRSDEPEYAFLWDKESQTTNRYGQRIELVDEDSELRCQSLLINDDPEIGDNPNRYKQHGFYFNADNCIGCHACEAACSEKNDNPAHIAFRSVGFVEGGSYPDYQRINISMACNHCDDPVCLKGCPTRAYTKYAEYGAVLQDPDICFGCGYCTWVCPYNAPQLDPVKGQVTKCNMCVDRLEVGLKPSCVSACLGNALDFGVVENIPEKRIEAKTSIPGFPTPEITHPNIRFQQTRSTEREMTRTDDMAVKYHKDDQAKVFKPQIDRKHGVTKEWNWRKLLGSHESAHVMFTLATQAVLGAFGILLAGDFGLLGGLGALGHAGVKLPTLSLLLVLLAFGLFKLNMHLGKPHRFYRGFNNLRYSPVSREILGVSGFFGLFCGYSLFSVFGLEFTDWVARLCGFGAALSGAVGLYYMYRIYRIKARPFWDHWQTATAFAGNALSLGALLLGLCILPLALTTGATISGLVATLLPLTLLGLGLEAVGHLFHDREMRSSEHEGGVSRYLQTTRYGKAWMLRNGLLAGALIFGLVMFAFELNRSIILVDWLLLAGLSLAAAIISRSLFFVCVIPTTMPGAFFWKNQSFIEHARDTGLVDMEQVGVVREQHGEFKLDELIDTIKNARPKDVIKHIKGIVVWKKTT